MDEIPVEAIDGDGIGPAGYVQPKEIYGIPRGVLGQTTHRRLRINAAAEAIRQAWRLVRRGWDILEISMVDDDVQDDDIPCPACGHHETRSRDCTEIGCEDGWIDEHDEDPVNYAPGEEYEKCPECHGHGIVRWCRKCGADYWIAKANKETSHD